MPIGRADLSDVYELYLRPAIERCCGLRCERAGAVPGSAVVMDEIQSCILRARIVIAELTGTNPNVLYETGLSDASEKKVLLLAQSMKDVPFDLRHRGILIYEFTPRGCKALEQAVVRSIDAVLAA